MQTTTKGLIKKYYIAFAIKQFIFSKSILPKIIICNHLDEVIAATTFPLSNFVFMKMIKKVVV